MIRTHHYTHSPRRTAALLVAVCVVVQGGCNRSRSDLSDPATHTASPGPMQTAHRYKPLRIQYDTTEGKALGAGVQRVERRLSIAGTPATATYTSVRAPLDAPGMPIGVFSSVLTAEQSQALRRTAHAAKWDAPQAPGRGGPGRSYMQVRYEDESLQATLGFSQMDIEVMEQVESFLEQLRSVVGMVTAHPKRALRVGVVHGSGPDAAFELVLENIGKEPFCMYDPRRLGSTPGDAWAAVQVAPVEPSVPGVTAPALQWESIPLLPAAQPDPSSAPATPPSLVLQPGQSRRFPTRAWQAKSAQAHIVQAVVHDYEAPEQIDGVPCLRGAAFSEHLDLPRAK